MYDPGTSWKKANVVLIVSVGPNGRVRLASASLLYLAPVFCPVPTTPRPSMETTTPGGRVGSVTTVAVMTTGPANFTVSGSPVFTDEAVPETWRVKVETVDCAEAAGAASSSAPTIPPSKDRKVPRDFFMLRSISSLRDFIVVKDLLFMV